MLRVNNSRKSKLTKKQYFMAIGGLVAGLALTTPAMSINAYAEEVLYEDNNDDYKTEDITDKDVVQDNTVTNQETEKQEENKQEEQTQEENKNNGGSCVTPENGYTEGQGKDWDPSIKTEPEIKGLTPDTPPDNPPENPDTPENPTEETTVETTQTQTVITTAPIAAPKTGDLSGKEIAAVLATLLGIANGVGYVVSKKTYNNSLKRK